MKTTLIEYTGKGRSDEQWHAAHVLVFTKSTRLNMDPQGFERIQQRTPEELEKELSYMAATIPSSWEFVDVTFLVQGVSRACAQQMTRTRTASYAMQSQRVTDVSEAEVHNPCEHPVHRARFENEADKMMQAYSSLLEDGVALQDARGLLPMNITCNLVCKYNLRSFVELVRARESIRTQGEYAEVVSAMKREVLAAWPWAETFFEPKAAKALGLLQEVVDDLGMETGKGNGWQIAKAMDLIRGL